jgi:hypothetical protein
MDVERNECAALVGAERLLRHESLRYVTLEWGFLERSEVEKEGNVVVDDAFMFADFSESTVSSHEPLGSGNSSSGSGVSNSTAGNSTTIDALNKTAPVRSSTSKTLNNIITSGISNIDNINNIKNSNSTTTTTTTATKKGRRKFSPAFLKLAAKNKFACVLYMEEMMRDYGSNNDSEPPGFENNRSGSPEFDNTHSGSPDFNINNYDNRGEPSPFFYELSFRINYEGIIQQYRKAHAGMQTALNATIPCVAEEEYTNTG